MFAEREGFEPPEPFSSTVFKTAVIDHSTTSPRFGGLFCNRIANIDILFGFAMDNVIFLFMMESENKYRLHPYVKI